ncbi:uncharacterized protein LOC106878001 isoform X2 [Octopus bimaculoides]|uniref:uncharacterized protein LOC106878001 isoform X2 n=1 Tax=Octopus bimaculoides TaxID=37653 RepID=UPI00071C6849|nr:uncharacterized protein LOC106878001 isoform X2 [Octopus bimaculoides]XP_052828853.1 uncharacterized protein LOC106878001 isoform X2 [Octopus bimaculoides]|eukprot:XP_014782563.1 PREDICTED: uncharacterized protein LOC106878001 isoform X2 [Octopus bimaculoides]
MEIPEEIADRLEKEVNAKHLLSELKGLTDIAREIEREIDRHGINLGMKEIIRHFPRFDNWDYYLVKALKSRAIQKKAIAEELSQWICRKKKFHCSLIHFEYFSCLDELNDADLNPNWKDLAHKLKLKTEDINKIEKNQRLEKNFMYYVIEKLGEKSLDNLLLALKELRLTRMCDEIEERVEFRQHPQQNHQAQPFEPPTGTAYSYDSYFQENKLKEEEKKGVSSKLNSSLTHDKHPIECTSLKSESRPLNPITDQENKLKKFNNAEKNENTIESHSSPEDNTSVKATAIYSCSGYDEQQIESDSIDSQDEENNLNIDERNLDASAAEEMPDVAPPNNDRTNERINSENGDVADIKICVIIFLGICITGMFLVRKYFKH